MLTLKVTGRVKRKKKRFSAYSMLTLQIYRASVTLTTETLVSSPH